MKQETLGITNRSGERTQSLFPHRDARERFLGEFIPFILAMVQPVKLFNSRVQDYKN